MYYSNYEDYMRMVLGYPPENSNTYSMYENNCYSMPINNSNTMTNNIEEIESLYPEIYRTINPMVCQMCDNNTEPISKELVEQMTERIYTTVEGNINTTININVETNKKVENRNSKEPVKAEVKETRQRMNNPLLRDLIRILILNRLLGGNRPPRPPFPGRPGHGRPPFPGNPFIL